VYFVVKYKLVGFQALKRYVVMEDGIRTIAGMSRALLVVDCMVLYGNSGRFKSRLGDDVGFLFVPFFETP
jgi:hypothetical protein